MFCPLSKEKLSSTKVSEIVGPFFSLFTAFVRPLFSEETYITDCATFSLRKFGNVYLGPKMKCYLRPENLIEIIIIT